MDNTKAYFAFLSGYFDSEGCLIIYYSKKGKYGSIQWIIKSNDRIILSKIVTKLRYFDNNIKYPKLVIRAGT
jgi:hypothetical protein